MLRQIIRLWRLSACNLFGWNRFRYTKDPKKKKKSVALGCVIGVLALLLEGYLIASYVLYCMMGQEAVIPMYGYLLTGMLLFLFTVLKAGDVIFQKKGFEVLMSLPVTKNAIVISRFLNMYTSNLLLSFLVLFPGMLILGIWRGMGVTFYLFYAIGIFLAPLFPMTVATVLSVLIKWVSSKMKYKSLAEAFLALLVLGGSFALTGSIGTVGPQAAEDFLQETEKLLQNIAVLLEQKTAGIYPPAVWFAHAVLRGDIGKFALLAVSAVLLFVLFVWVANLCFDTIYTALGAVYAKKDYREVTGEVSSVLGALLKRELRRYFSCGIYLSNTIVGPGMMAGVPVALCIFGADAIQKMIPLENAVERGLPFVLALCGILVPTTVCSVSLEGRQRWITLSLPIPKKQRCDSKILMFLLVSAPFYLAAVLVSAISMRLTGADLLCLILVPAFYLVFGAVLGLTVNLRFPVFDWESEVEVVKQGAAVAICAPLSLVSVLVPGALYILLGEKFGWPVLAVILIAIAGGTIFLYRRMIRETNIF